MLDPYELFSQKLPKDTSKSNFIQDKFSSIKPCFSMFGFNMMTQ